MTPTSNDKPTSLSDVLYQFSLEDRRLDADLLEEYVHRFKEYAAPLTDFAIELAVDRLRDECTPLAKATVPSGDVSPMVSRAISRFHNRLYQLSHIAPKTTERSGQTSVSQPVNPFSDLDQVSFRSLTKALGVNSVILLKLRDRLIEPATIPVAFVRKLARAVGASVDSIRSHLGAQPEMGLQFYKADRKPDTTTRQSFRDAVETSGLTAEEQRDLLL